MNKKHSLFEIVKLPLLIAFAVIVLRLILEFYGAPETVNKIFGVAWLHLIMPIYLAFKIVEHDFEKPFVVLVKTILLFSIPVRFAVALTYSLAHYFKWAIPRFAMVTGENVTPLSGYFTIPASAFAFYVLLTLVVGIVTGGITLYFKTRAAGSKTGE
ncbi:MAG: hypothetical protein DWQ05_16395 [Calditrichaeota bacterium]|nr:MAG: hypothetical protein DWQ05_16395 [Calditrichota bacterium]